MKVKSAIKGLIPGTLLRIYQRTKMLNYRLGVVEQEMRNQWLLSHEPDLKDQKEVLRRHEFKIYSQTGEDGIITHIFDRIGVKNKTFVEIGVEDGRECNTAHLSLNFGWKGTLIEANAFYAKKAEEYYAQKPVTVVRGFVTQKNVNNLISQGNTLGAIDLLSIDIDGNDYWVWDAITVIKPRVVVMEYNSILGQRATTIAYNERFSRLDAHASGFYYGASLAALTKLAHAKGYILVGCCSSGFNAFFVRKEDAKGAFKELSPEEADYLPNGREETSRRFARIKHMPLVHL